MFLQYELILFAFFAYFLGSLNGAQILHHILRKKFPRHITRIGTKNAGAQNIWMNIGKVAGMIVFAIDFLKGYLMISMGRTFGFEGAALILLGAFSILGHNWPIFFHLRGGRGFATLIGIFYAFDIKIALIASAVSLPFVILRFAGITPFIFLIIGSLAFYSSFGSLIVGSYLLMAIILFSKRLYAERAALHDSSRKLAVIKNLLLYDRAANKPPDLRALLS